MNNSKNFPARSIWPSLVVVSLSILVLVAGSSTAGAASLPSLTDTINPLPGPGCYGPVFVGVNNTTQRVYASGGDAVSGPNGRISVIDAQSKTVLAGISLPFGGQGLALNESLNRIYVGTTASDGFTKHITAINGATNQVIGDSAGDLGWQPLVDPNTARIFAVTTNNGSAPASIVRVYDGTTLALISSINLDDNGQQFFGVAMALNPTTRKLYVSGNTSNGQQGIAVVNLDSLTEQTIIHPAGASGVGNLAVDPGTGKVFVGATLTDGSGNNTPAVLVVNSSTDTVLTTIPLTQNDYGILGGFFVGVAVDTTRHRAYFSEGFSPNPVTVVIDTQNNSFLGSLPVPFSFGGVLTSTGEIFAGQNNPGSSGFWALENAIGVISPGTGAVEKITTGYKPFVIQANANTGRLYVNDSVGNEILVFNSDHSLAARVFVGGSTDIAVSAALNRVYSVRANPADLSVFLDVIDGSSNQVARTVTVVSGGPLSTPKVAVDDSRHRIYVTALAQDNTSRLYVFDSNSNTPTTNVPIVRNLFGLGVDPGSGRIYIPNHDNGFGQVQVLDPSSLTQVASPAAGAAPGPMAFDSQRNKLYVANTGAGSVDNSITVIDTSTNATEATIQNVPPSNAHDISCVAANSQTNTIFGGDASDGSAVHGYISGFDGGNNYNFIGQRDADSYPVRMLVHPSTHELFVSNYEGTIDVFGGSGPPPPPAPPHGGLSATIFTINGSQTAPNNVADTALHFAAQQSGTPAGLKVRVQLNTTPNNDANDWVDLPDGSSGYMTIDKSTGKFVLSSTNYPLVNNLYFRALSTASSYPESKSNIIGPINLSGTQNHLGSTTLYMATNGGGQEMKFRVKIGVDEAGTSLRIQTTTSPDDDSSWAYLNDGNSGGMLPFADRTQFYLDKTKYPTGDAVYFRAVATATGFVNSISNILGVTNVVNGTPPDVSVFPSTLDQLQPGSGSGTSPNDPLILALGPIKFTVQASSPEGKQLTAVALMYGGSTINKSEASTGVSGTLNTDYLTSVPGDYVLKAFAKDARGVIGFADPVYIRILPPNGKVFTMINSGDWNTSTNWQDSFGQNGIPGANDLAVIANGQQVTVSTDVVAFAISLLNGTVTGSGGTLKVTGIFSIATGQLHNLNLTIDTHGSLAITGDTDVQASGSVTNLGTIHILGAGGIIPVLPQSAAQTPANSPSGVLDGIAAFFKNVGDVIFHHPSVKPKPTPPPATAPKIRAPRGVSAAGFDNQGRLLSENGIGLIGDSGSTLIGDNGASVIGNDGASLITNDGGSVISNDGASLITHDGATLNTNDAGSLITNDGGSLRVRPNSSSNSNFKAEAADSVLTLSGGQFDLRHLLVMSSVEVNGGVLLGSGVIYGDLTNNSGYISPGHSAGNISVIGNFAQGDSGTLIVENGGPIGGQSDFLQVSGSATLGGKLHLKTLGSYVPDAADTFSPLSYNAVSGSMTASSNAQVTVNATGLQVAINPTIAGPSSGQPLNIATRLAIQGGDNVLIAGFIVTGPSGSTKKVLIRGIGPSLTNLGVAGAISDPLLELHEPDGSVVVNDNWQQGDISQIPNGFAPNDSRESVIVATLTPGSYSALVKGAHGETGVGLAEVYDLESASAAKLANVATRGLVQTGDNVLIGGFIIGGTEPAKVIVRAIGPSLAAFGIPNPLPATTLELHDANGSVIANEGWRNTQESEIIATTIPPTSDDEAAIVATLVPGTYTAVVRGRNNTTGIAVIEAYNLQ